MTCRTITAAVLATSLVAGGADTAMAQSAPPLKGSLLEGAAADDAGAPVPIRKPIRAEMAETNLEIAPLDPQAADSAAIVPLVPEPPRRRKAVEDPYAPTGIGNTGIRFFPAITVGAVYSSNINESKDKPESGGGLQLRPSLRVESNWIRHSLTGGLDGSMVTYAGQDEYDTKTLDVFQRLRLDVRRHTTATLDARYALDQAGAEESTEHTLSGSAAVAQDFGPMTATLRTGLTGRYFEDVEVQGVTQDNSDRNYIEPVVSIRTTFNQPQAIRPFIEASYAPRLHRDAVDRNGIARDSQGFGVTAGIEVLAEPLWSGELGLTYLHRNYKDDLLDNTGVLGLTGSVTWSPTELTSVVMEVGTSLDESTSPTLSASRRWTASADLTHAMRDNVDLLAGASLEVEAFEEKSDKSYDLNLGLSWKLNPILSWSAAYDFTWLDAAEDADSYVEHRVSTGLTVSR